MALPKIPSRNQAFVQVRYSYSACDPANNNLLVAMDWRTDVSVR